MTRYGAPWSRSVMVVSALVTVVVAVLVIAARSADRYGWSFLVPVVAYLGAIMFMIRGYTILPDAILVRRLLWATRLSRTDLESATHDPQAMRGSVRTFGNGGLFGATGWFWNRKLRTYRAFVTDPGRAVVLRYPTRRIVISPSDPERFVAELQTAHSL
jgi:hypothetical protein